MKIESGCCPPGQLFHGRTWNPKLDGSLIRPLDQGEGHEAILKVWMGTAEEDVSGLLRCGINHYGGHGSHPNSITAEDAHLAPHFGR
jgi:hypothetical protein